MVTVFDQVREIISDFCDNKPSFSFQELREELMKNNLPMRTGPGQTIHHFLNHLLENKYLCFDSRTKRYSRPKRG